ncbi:MAG: hypothetical protein AB1938_17230 [Myxococcota bacterium]
MHSARFLVASLLVLACACDVALPVCQFNADCPAGQRCAEGSCHSMSACAAGCPAGTRCAGEECLPQSCGSQACAADQVCQGGSCVDVGCVGVNCPLGTACADGVCLSTSCGAEACASGRVCVGGACIETSCVGVVCAQGQTCAAGVCVAARCDDGQKNGDESDVDCGGSCPKCPNGAVCDGLANNCASNACDAGVCVPAPACTDQVTNGDETDEDCGGSCPKCRVGQACRLPSDCLSGLCNGVCQAPVSCTDGQKNGDESATDCGGSCPGCPAGLPCTAPSDCAGGLTCGTAGTCAAGCTIAGAFVAAGTANPANPCEACVPATSTSAWSPATDGTTCGGRTCDAWGTCGGFATTCSQDGTQTRSCTAQVCVAGACVASTVTETQACTRSTEGDACGSTTCGGFGPCGGFSGICGESGSQSRSCTRSVCRAGACASESYTDSQSCSRNTDGQQCATGSWSACQFSGCSATGTQTRTPYDCNNGSCSSPQSPVTQTCTRSVQCSGGSSSCTVTLSPGQSGCPAACGGNCYCPSTRSCNTSSCTWNSCVRTGAACSC